MITSTARPERTGQGSGSRVRGGSNRAHPGRACLARAKREPRDDLCRWGHAARTDSRQQIGAGVQRPPGQISPVAELEQRLLDVGDRHEQERGAVAEVVELPQPLRVVRLRAGPHRIGLEGGGRVHHASASGDALGARDGASRCSAARGTGPPLGELARERHCRGTGEPPDRRADPPSSHTEHQRARSGREPPRKPRRASAALGTRPHRRSGTAGQREHGLAIEQSSMHGG